MLHTIIHSIKTTHSLYIRSIPNQQNRIENMSSKKYDSFKDVNKLRYDWKVTARVMNLWRGVSLKGEVFTSFNLLLVDHKVKHAIH